MKLRNREGDPPTWKEFMTMASRDLGVGQEFYGQQVKACLQKADFMIENRGTRKQLNNKIDKLLISLNIEKPTKGGPDRI
jgi:hypothetical protein